MYCSAPALLSSQIFNIWNVAYSLIDYSYLGWSSDITSKTIASKVCYTLIDIIRYVWKLPNSQSLESSFFVSKCIIYITSDLNSRVYCIGKINIEANKVYFRRVASVGEWVFVFIQN